jgi:hypothetical protein
LSTGKADFKQASRSHQTSGAFGIRGIAVLVTCINECGHDGLQTTNGLRMARSEALLREPSRSELKSKSHSGIHWMAKGANALPITQENAWVADHEIQNSFLKENN